MPQKLLKYSFLFCIPILYILPLILNRNGGIWVSQTYGHEHRSVELLGFSASLAWAFAIYTAYKRGLLLDMKEILWAMAFSGVYFVFLHAISDHVAAQYDYLLGYERAALFLNEGKNPYEGTSYIYPPLLVQVLGSILKIAPVHDLFYTYQVFQWLNVLLLFQLLYTVFKPYTSAKQFPFLPILIALLMLTSVPLYRTLHWQQVNVILLNLMLIGFLYAEKNVLLSGLAFAVGIHLKIYPVIFGTLFLCTNHKKVVLSTGIWTGIIFILQTSFLQEMTLYSQFLASFQHTLGEIPSSDFFRNNSIRSPFIFIFYTWLKLPEQTAAILVRFISLIWQVLMLIWVVFRCYKRHMHNTDAFFIFWGNVWDCIALMLLVSPLLWEHHFVHCLPLLLAAFLTSAAKNLRMWVICLVLIGLLPTFDVFLFSYHRMLGLILLLKILPIYSLENGENMAMFVAKKLM